MAFFIHYIKLKFYNYQKIEQFHSNNIITNNNSLKVRYWDIAHRYKNCINVYLYFA